MISWPFTRRIMGRPDWRRYMHWLISFTVCNNSKHCRYSNTEHEGWGWEKPLAVLISRPCLGFIFHIILQEQGIYLNRTHFQVTNNQQVHRSTIVKLLRKQGWEDLRISFPHSSKQRPYLHYTSSYQLLVFTNAFATTRQLRWYIGVMWSTK